jgi:sugar phosphate isomerase/epimerase
MKLSITVQTPEVPCVIPVALLVGSLEEKMAKAARWGADGIELMTSNPKELKPSEIKSCLCANGLEASAVASGAITMSLGITLLHRDPASAELARTRLYELIDFASAIGAPLVTIGSFRGKLANVESGGRELLADTLRNAAAYAQAVSVRIALEALNRYEGDIVNNYEEGLAFLGEVNHPALGLLLDTYHVNVEEASWSKPFQRTLQAGKLFHVHLGDNNRLPPGRGLIDFAAILATLRENAYTGFLSAELLARPDPDTAAKETLSYIRALMEMYL